MATVRQAQVDTGYLIVVEVDISIDLVLLGNMPIEKPHTAISRCKGLCQTATSDNRARIQYRL